MQLTDTVLLPADQKDTTMMQTRLSRLSALNAAGE